APVDHFAIGFEMRSEMNAPPKPMMPAKIASIPTLSPLCARNRSAPRSDAVMLSTTMTAMLVTISRKMRFMCASERDVVLEIVELATLAGRLRRRRFGSSATLRAFCGSASARFTLPAAHALARTQHLHDVGHDLRRVFVLPILVLPLARLQASLAGALAV